MQNTSHTKLQSRLAAIEASTKRWQSRLTRAVNAINKLRKQRERLAKQVLTPNELKQNAVHQIAAQDVPRFLAETSVKPADPLDIPAEFKRPASGSPGPKLLADLINKPFIDAANRKRLARLDEKRRGRSRFDKTDMPLNDKDALAAIKAERKKKKST